MSKVLKKISIVKKSNFFETLDHSKNYLVVQITKVGISIFTIPFFTAIYSTEDYGTVALYFAYLALLIPIMSLNSHGAIGRYYYEKTTDFPKFISSSIIYTSLIFIVFSSFALLFIDKISRLMNFSKFIILLMISNSFILIIQQIYMQILIPQKRSKEVAAINVLNLIFGTALSVILVLQISEKRYLGQIYGTLIISFLFTIYFAYKLSSYFSFDYSTSHFKYIFTFSVPLMPYILSGLILAQFDRIMISQYRNLEDVGFYSIGYSIANFFLMGVSATQTALTPEFFEKHRSKEYQKIEDLTSRIFKFIILAAIAMILFVEEIFMVLVDEKFHSSQYLVPIIVVGMIFFSIFMIYSRYIAYSKRTIYSSMVLISAAILNIFLNYLFIPRYGYIAAAFTTSISYFTLFIITWLTVKLIIQEKHMIRLRIIYKPLLLTLVFYFFYYFYLINISWGIFKILIKLSCLLISAIILYINDIQRIL